MTTVGDGLFQYGGEPVGGVRFTNPWSRHWFVDGTDGNDNNEGFAPESAKATIDAAIQAAGRGDVIYVRPKAYTVGTGFARYTETGTVDLTQSDLHIIGVSNSPNPEYGVRWAKTSSGYNIDCSGPALHVENIGFFSEGATGTALLRNNGATDTQRGTDGTTFVNCVVKGGRIITADGGDGTTFENCLFHGSAGVTGGITATGSANPGRRLRIRDCAFLEGNGAAVATEYINIAGVYSEVQIHGCRFGLIPTSAKYILVTSSTGMISHCWFAKADLDLTSDMTLDSLVYVELLDATMVVPS
jgi:hypothetical protein